MTRCNLRRNGWPIRIDYNDAHSRTRKTTEFDMSNDVGYSLILSIEYLPKIVRLAAEKIFVGKRSDLARFDQHHIV